MGKTTLPASHVPRLRPRRELYPDLKPWDLKAGLFYGPFKTRRKGMSLGINLLPPEDKVCSFNCVYCQCGWTPGRPPSRDELRDACPDLDTVRQAFEEGFPRFVAEGNAPDSIVFSGNGEPTLYPDFPEAMELLLSARDRHLPGVPVTLLTDGTELGDPAIRAAAQRCDKPTVKLDAGDEATSRSVDIPMVKHYSVAKLLEWLGLMEPVTIQSCFVRGAVDNTTEAAMASWWTALERVQPAALEVYSLDRVPAAQRLEQVPLEWLQELAGRVTRDLGIPTEAV
jgi:wyosine [tRNA(Phe)-imidazoG37] synthetase (radical SAM superfamily)